MADFRKLFLVLAVLAAVAVSANAQTTFGCTAGLQGPQTVVIRDGGLTELVGDVVLQCSGTAPTATVTANFRIFMNTTVTNKLGGARGSMGTQSGLLVNEGLGCAGGFGCPVGVTGVSTVVGGVLQPNLVTGDVKNTRNSILYPQVVLPTGTTTTVRITNVRVVAPPASNTFIQTQVIEFIATEPVGVIPITNPQQPVATVLPGVVFTTSKCSDPYPNFAQCISEPRPSNPNVSFRAIFTEGFQTAFKPQGPGTTIPGTQVLTESGLTFQGAPTGGMTLISDVADSGTKLLIRFAGVPAGVHIFVADHSGSGSSAGAAAVLVGVNDPSGTSGSAASPLTGGDDATGCATGEGVKMYEVPIAAGAGAATYEVTASTIAQDVLVFGVGIAYTSNTTAGLPGLTSTPGSISGNFGPISTVDYADSGSKIPRFLDKPQGQSTFTISPCVTNILFPYVTNQGGFDTGIALVNTSLDNATGSSGTPPNQPFNTNTQHGTCTVYYFGSMAGGGALPTPQTTTDVAAGQMTTFAISQGGVAGATSSAAGFQGYVIARCNFQFAHGYAFVSDLGAQKLAHGYLALIIPDKGQTKRVPDPFTAAGAGAGEQLAP